MTVHDPRYTPQTIVVQVPQELQEYQEHRMILPQRYEPKPAGVPWWAIVLSALALITVLAFGTGMVSLTKETATAEAPTMAPTTQPTIAPTRAPAVVPAIPTAVPAKPTAEPTVAPTAMPEVLLVTDAEPAEVPAAAPAGVKEQVIVVRTTAEQHVTYTGSGACAVAIGHGASRCAHP